MLEKLKKAAAAVTRYHERVKYDVDTDETVLKCHSSGCILGQQLRMCEKNPPCGKVFAVKKDASGRIVSTRYLLSE